MSHARKIQPETKRGHKPVRKVKVVGISLDQEKKDLKSAFKSSRGFGNAYGEEEPEENLAESSDENSTAIDAVEKLSPEDDEFDFGIQDLEGDDQDLEEIKKAFRH